MLCNTFQYSVTLCSVACIAALGLVEGERRDLSSFASLRKINNKRKHTCFFTHVGMWFQTHPIIPLSLSSHSPAGLLLHFPARPSSDPPTTTLIIYPQKLLVQPYKQLLKQARLIEAHELRLSGTVALMPQRTPCCQETVWLNYLLLLLSKNGLTAFCASLREHCALFPSMSSSFLHFLSALWTNYSILIRWSVLNLCNPRKRKHLLEPARPSLCSLPA